MQVEGYCRSCNQQFDAHWSNYPDLALRDVVLNLYCTYCKSTDVFTTTDESLDVDNELENLDDEE